MNPATTFMTYFFNRDFTVTPLLPSKIRLSGSVTKLHTRFSFLPGMPHILPLDLITLIAFQEIASV
jgi:hypothetical protein